MFFHRGPQALGQNERALELAASPVETDEWGTPLNNGINADGSRFGHWYYRDAAGNPFFRRTYAENEERGQEIRLGNAYKKVDNRAVSAAEWESDAQKLLTRSGLVPGGTRGLAFVIDPLTRDLCAVHAYGDWSPADLRKINRLAVSTANTNLEYVSIYWK